MEWKIKQVGHRLRNSGLGKKQARLITTNDAKGREESERDMHIIHLIYSHILYRQKGILGHKKIYRQKEQRNSAKHKIKIESNGIA